MTSKQTNLPVGFQFRMGMPFSTYYFADGRISAGIDEQTGGINLIEYHGGTSRGFHRVFGCYQGGDVFRFKWDGIPCRFEDVAIYPFGFNNCFKDQQQMISNSMCLRENRGVFSMGSSQAGKSAELTFNRKSLVQSQRKIIRKWDEPAFDRRDNALWLHFLDEGLLPPGDNPTHPSSLPPLECHYDIYAAIGCTEPMVCRITATSVILSAKPKRSDPVVFFLVFGSSRKEVKDSLDKIIRHPDADFTIQLSRYQKLAATLPAIATPVFKRLSLFFSNWPLYHDCARIEVGKNVIHRSGNLGYWISAWNNLLQRFGLLQCGWYEDVARGLRFMNEHCMPDGSIPHYWTNDFRPFTHLGMGNAADLLYMIMAHRYYSYTLDDHTLCALYPHLKKIFLGIRKLCDDRGYYLTVGFGSDHPPQFGRQNFANVTLEMGWWYDACRCMEHLAAIMNDPATRAVAGELIALIRSNFEEVFYDRATGFLIESYDPVEDWRCDFPFLSSIGCMNGYFGDEILPNTIKPLAEYCIKNFVVGDGIRQIPAHEKRGFQVWTSQYANWFFRDDAFLGKLLRRANQGRAIESILATYDRHFAWAHCVGEAAPFMKHDKLVPCWHLWGGRSWYSFLIEAAAGIEADIGGLTYIPCNMSQSMAFTKLPFRQTQWDITITGQGDWVQEMMVDDKPLPGSFKILLQHLKPGKHRLNIIRSAHREQRHPILMEARGIALAGVTVNKGSLRASLKGTGRARVRFYSPHKPEIRIKGKPFISSWDQQDRTGNIEFFMNRNENVSLTITGHSL